jgi:hypothetical protein
VRVGAVIAAVHGRHDETKGDTGSKVYLAVPVTVASTAQIPAGWALYNSLATYPNFVGMTALLQEGSTPGSGAPRAGKRATPRSWSTTGTARTT